MTIGRRPFLAGSAATVFASTAAFATTDRTAFLGEWNGVLDAGSARLRLTLIITQTDVALISKDQNNARIPADSVELNGEKISLVFDTINAKYVGILTDGALEGNFTQGATFPLTFVRGEAKAPQPAPLDSDALKALRERASAPAMIAAAQTRDGEEISFVDGLRVFNSDAAATTDDKWHVGSITKSMTATLIARLVEAGEIAWDETIGAILGSAANDMHPDYADVSFLHLLSHRAGLQANIPMLRLITFPRTSDTPQKDRLAFATIALSQKPAGPKQTSFLYSNNGYVIAGAMLEARTGRSWETLIHEHVFEPLGMSTAGIGAPGTKGVIDQPVGHSKGLFGLRAHPPGKGNTDNPAALGPAGRVHASASDMLRYLNAHRDRSDFLSPESWERLHTPPFGGDYALGWVVRNDGLWHNGSNTLWYAEASFSSDTKVSAFAAANFAGSPETAPAVGKARSRAAYTLMSV